MIRPGDRIRAIAARLSDAATMERVIEPALADLQCEYAQALARGHRWRARLSLVRSYAAFGSVLAWLAARTAWQAAGPRSEVARTALVSAIASALVTVPFVIPPMLQSPWWQGDPAFAALISVTLIPQALPLSIPAGLCVAVLWAMRGTTVTWGRVGTVLALALALTAAVWVVLEWMMPQANQGFREMIAARLSDGRVVTLEPGLNELGLSRLAQRSDAAAVRHYQLLWALCFASAPLGLLALGLARYIRRAVSAVAVAIALFNAYFAILWVTTASTTAPALPAAVAAWTPNLLFVLIGSALLARNGTVDQQQDPRATSARDRSPT